MSKKKTTSTTLTEQIAMGVASKLGISPATSKQVMDFATPLLDQNKDGNVLDDVTYMGMKMLGKVFKK